MSGPLPWLRRRLYGLSFVDEFGPVYAVYTLWFSDNGIGAAELSSVFLVWSIVALVLEIPSGAVADLVDRRRLLALAFVVRAAGISIWLIWPTLPGALLGAVLWAIHDAMASGSWEAMIHDQLAAVGAADRYGTIMARIGQFSHLGVAAGTVVGAGLLRVDVDLVVLGWLTVAAHAGSISLVSTLPSVESTDPPDDDAGNEEDGDQGPDRATGPHPDPDPDPDPDPAPDRVTSGDRATGRPVVPPAAAGWWSTLRSGLDQARSDPLVLRLVAIGALLEGLWVVDEYLPLVSRVQGGSDATAPILILIVWLGLLAGGELAARRPGWGGPSLGPMLAAGSVTMVAALAAGRVWVLALVAAGYATLEATNVIADARLQERTDGEVRATVTSIRGFGAAATSMVMFLVIGAMAVGDDPRPGLYVLLGALTAVAVLVARWVPSRVWGVPPTVADRSRS